MSTMKSNFDEWKIDEITIAAPYLQLDSSGFDSRRVVSCNIMIIDSLKPIGLPAIT